MARWIDADKLLENCIIKNEDGESIGRRSFVSVFDIDTAHYIDITDVLAQVHELYAEMEKLLRKSSAEIVGAIREEVEKQTDCQWK